MPSGGSLQVSGAVPGQFLKVKEVDEKGVPTAWETGFEKPKYQKIYEVELTDTVSKIVVDFTKGKYTEADIFFESFSVLKDGTETSNTGILRISYMDINDNARRICGDATNCVGSSNSSRKARVHLQIDELGILRGLMQNTEYTIEHMSHINPSLYVYEHLEKLQFAEKNNNMFMAGTKVEVWAR